MNAKETKIQPFIEGTKQFVVPLFQRPYSWERKHWETLWDDLMELYEEEQYSGPQNLDSQGACICYDLSPFSAARRLAR